MMQQTLADVIGEVSDSVTRSCAAVSTDKINEIRDLAEQPNIESGINGVSVPAISALEPEYLAPESIDVQYDLAVHTGHRFAEEKSTGATLDGEVKAGLLGVGQARGEILATLCNGSQSARSTDTRARMSIRMKFEREPLPDGIRLLVDAANKASDLRNQAVIEEYAEKLSRK